MLRFISYKRVNFRFEDLKIECECETENVCYSNYIDFFFFLSDFNVLKIFNVIYL